MHKASQAAIRRALMAGGISPSYTRAALRAIADGQNARKIPTARGNGEWTATQVRSGTQRSLSGHDPRPSGGIGEAATKRSIGASTLKKVRVIGCGPEFHRIGRRIVYSSETLDEWARRKPSTSRVERQTEFAK
jgi:hypothetical protein